MNNQAKVKTILSMSKSILKQKQVNKNDDKMISMFPQVQKYDTNKLFQQFKRHLFRQDKKQLNKNIVITNEYKNLLCQVRKNKQQRKNIVQKMQAKRKSVINLSRFSSQKNISQIINMHKQTRPITSKLIRKDQSKEQKINPDLSASKFKPIRVQSSDNKFRINSSKSKLVTINESRYLLESNIISTLFNLSKDKNEQKQNQNPDNTQFLQNNTSPQLSLEQISQNILMVQVEQSRLQQQISSLKKSLNQLKKQLQTVNKQLQIQIRNQEKYKHISYLATSIKNQTDYIKFQNVKGYYGMVGRQEDTISQMKKFKTNLRKEKDEMENVYIEQINGWVARQQEKSIAKKRQFLFSSTNTPKNEGRNSGEMGKTLQKLGNQQKNNQRSSKINKKLIDHLDVIIQLLKEKQPDFESIKQQQCTKIRLGKINKSLLSKDHVQMLDRIQQFEHKFDMKIGSIQNLILSIYKRLFEQNEIFQQKCVKMTKHKQQLGEQLKMLNQKHQTQISCDDTNRNKLSEEQSYRKKLNQNIKKTSNVFVKIINALYTVLFKFRYMFSLALTLDVDKKSFRDCVIQIDTTFSSGLFFNFAYQKHLVTSSQRHDIINQKQFKDLLTQKKIPHKTVEEMTQLMFNDHRINLIAHKSWLENRFKYLSPESIEQNDVLEIIESVRHDCQQIYKMKLPSLINLFLTCYKSISMSKYEMKLAASSNQKGSIFLPTGPTKKVFCLQAIDCNNDSYQKQTQQSGSYEPSKKNIQYTDSSPSKQEVKFEKDPRKIINHLEQIKNKSHRKFKALNFGCQSKAYKYNQQIVIPDFPFIDQDLQL